VECGALLLLRIGFPVLLVVIGGGIGWECRQQRHFRLSSHP
jgi:hypothetical protein